MRLTATLPRDYCHEVDVPAARQEVAPALLYFEAATFDEAKPPARLTIPSHGVLTQMQV